MCQAVLALLQALSETISWSPYIPDQFAFWLPPALFLAETCRAADC